MVRVLILHGKGEGGRGETIPKLFLSSSRDTFDVFPRPLSSRTDSICYHQHALGILMHQILGDNLNIPTCNFHIVLIVIGATHNTFVAENKNIIDKGNSTVK